MTYLFATSIPGGAYGTLQALAVRTGASAIRRVRNRIVLSDTITKLRTTSDQSCVILIVDSTDIVGADPFGTGSA
jgi:hypothetical protein